MPGSMSSPCRRASRRKISTKLLSGTGGTKILLGIRRRNAGVHQLFRLEVCGEDDHQLEGNLELQAITQVEVIHPSIHGQDPAVQQHGGRNDLAAEVIHDEDALLAFICAGAA